ncbi:MAG: WD40/YVTN/BNR-like repeat-containing protein, partial [Candidatus Kapaibacterium sp.]
TNVVYVSKDTGRTWKYVQSFSRPGYYWGCIGIVDEIFFGVSDGNLYRSTDKGETWVQVATKQVYSIGKWVGGDIYALTYTPKRALLRSSDSGVTWTQVMEYNEWILGLSESGVLWANEEGRLYKSTDSAKSWIDLSKEFRNTNIDKLFADQRDVHIYASTLSSKRQFGSNSSLPFYRVFRSNDGGDSWVPIYEGANDVKGVDNIGNIYLSYYDTVLTTTTEPAYYTMLRTILQSNDYGTTWNEILPDVALLPYTLDTIISSPSGIVVLDFTGYDTTYRYGSRFHSPVLSVDSGRTWMRGEEWIPKEISTLLTVHARSDGTLLIPDYHPSIDQAPASFVLWKYNPSSGELIVINNLAIDHFSIGEDGNLYGFSQRGIYYSSDNGDTWDSIPSAITTTSTFNYGIYGVRVSPEGHLMIIAWPYGGDRGLYISQNRGVTWEQVPQEHPHMIEPYIQLPRYMMGNDVLIDALHFDRLKTIYSPKGAHHYYSFSWSTDNGSVWKYSDDDPLAFKDVSTIFRSHDHRYFLVGTRYQGLYKSLNPYMRVSEVEREENITDIHMTLQTSFGEHTVQIEVDHPAYLRAQVFDCLGRRVRVLYDCNVEPGIYRLPISVPEIISGLYFLSVSIDDMVKTQPIPLN